MLSSWCVPAGIFILLNSPLLLSITRNCSPQPRVQTHTKIAAEQPWLRWGCEAEASQALCALMDLNEVLLAFSHRRHEPIEVQSAYLVVLKLICLFSSNRSFQRLCIHVSLSHWLHTGCDLQHQQTGADRTETRSIQQPTCL